MRRWLAMTVVINLLAGGLLVGCEMGWDFLKEGTSRKVGAQMNCAMSRVVTGQFPPSGALHPADFFRATYSSPRFSGTTSDVALALRISRHRLWLNDLSIEVSFFPFDDPSSDPRNGCVGRSILEINIPFEHLSFDGRSIDIQSTRLSQTEVSAYYAEGGDPGFTASAVMGTIWLRSINESRIQVLFDLTFNPGTLQRRLTNGDLEDSIDPNPAAKGL